MIQYWYQMQLSQNYRSCDGNLQIASGLVSFAGFISGVIADWGIAACTGNEHFIMHMTSKIISIMEGSGKR